MATRGTTSHRIALDKILYITYVYYICTLHYIIICNYSLFDTRRLRRGVVPLVAVALDKRRLRRGRGLPPLVASYRIRRQRGVVPLVAVVLDKRQERRGGQPLAAVLYNERGR